MEQTKRDGTIREQINLEDKVRRDYPRRWGPVTQTGVNEFYNPNYLCQELRKKCTAATVKCPFEYDVDHGGGESRFFSKDMYNELVAKCRCGRLRTGTHFLKCLQKFKSDSQLEPKRCNETMANGQVDNISTDSPDNEMGKPFPVTSSGVIGWPKHRYLDLERSTYYVSPKNSIPGGRIDDKPYSNIFIG